MNQNHYFVYIVTNQYHNVLYTGVTNDIQRRIEEHKTGSCGRFTSKYRCNKLVYYEMGEDVKAAIVREKQIKSGSRQKK
ncbi:MAG: GIY-YIG nuclease family protein [Anaerolineaceae bacterium]|nr:GIY-YIG nuclease family protein [Anaerolineaceae bacterium]